MRLRKDHSVLPGFRLALVTTAVMLLAVVIVPLGGLFVSASSLGLGGFWRVATDPRVVASYRVTFGASLAGALLNAFFGLIVAWTLVRYRFPGRRLIDALVDIPFALPTAVSGIALTTLYSRNGFIGRHLEAIGFKVAFTWWGIMLAMTFIGLPFVVRSLQPALEDLQPELEEAAATLGATRWQTFARVLFPTLAPALLTGFTMAFARALGEYGSVVFIAGNMPMKTEITALLIMTKLEQYDYAGATAIAVVMLGASFMLLLAINLLQWWSGRHHETGE